MLVLPLHIRLVGSGGGAWADGQVDLDGVDEILDGGVVGGGGLGFDHDGFDAEGQARVDAAEQGGQVDGAFDEGVGGVGGLPESAIGDGDAIAVQAGKDAPLGERDGGVDVVEAARVRGGPAPSKEIRHLPAPGEGQAEQEVVAGAATIGSLRVKGAVRLVGQGALQEFKVDVGIAAGAETVSRNNRPDVSIGVGVKWRATLLISVFVEDLPSVHFQVFGIIEPLEAATEDDVRPRVPVSIPEMHGGGRVQWGAGSSKAAPPGPLAWSQSPTCGVGDVAEQIAIDAEIRRRAC